jgi:alpha-beta hydrolase superfamily lysophospholipase
MIKLTAFLFSSIVNAMKLALITRTPVSNPRPTPLLFVHGSWHAAWCWDEYFLPYFAQHGYVAHALSLRGHGSSENDKALRFTRVADYVDDVAQVASGLAQPPVVIGHSMGAFVVQKYLESHEAPAGVLLAPMPPTGDLPALLRYGLRHPLTLLKNTLTLSLRYTVSTPELLRDVFFSADMPAEQVNAYHKQIQDESFTVIVLDATLLNLVKSQQIKSPMLVLGAANDTVFKVAEVEATARAYGTQAEIFPHMAHDMMLEAGWQQVADRIIAWLQARDL